MVQYLMHRKVAVQLDFVLCRQRNESIPEGRGGGGGGGGMCPT